MTPFFYFSFLFLVSLVTLKLLFQTRRFQNLPPGPPYLPIIGNFHQIKQPLHVTFHSLAQKYGQNFSLWFGSQLVLVVSSPSIVQECFTKNDIIFANRPHLLMGKYTLYNNTTVGVSRYGDHWRNLRRIISLEVLSSHRLNSFLKIRTEEIMMLIQKLAQDSWKDFAKVELKSMFLEMMFNTMMRMMAGKRYYGQGCDVADVEELVLFGGLNNSLDFIPILRWLDFGNVENKLKRIGTRFDVFLQGLVDEHRNGNKNTDTMIDHLLTQQRLQPEYYTDQIIKGIVLELLNAGTDTTAITLEWAMSDLLNHPEIMMKAKNELDTQVGQDRLVDESDISKLPYLQNIVNEVLRLHPAAPLLVPHFSSEDCTIGGYKVPKNTILLANVWATHRDPNLWSDSTIFKPERFEKEGEANKLLSFGLGRRTCPGSSLAQRTLSLTLGLLIQCFEWKRTGEEEIDMIEGEGLTAPKKNPLEAMCKVRRPSTLRNIF